MSYEMKISYVKIKFSVSFTDRCASSGTLLIELYPFIPLSVTLIFQGHSSVQKFQLTFLWFYLIKFKLYGTVKYVKKIMDVPPLSFFLSKYFKGGNWWFPHWENFRLGLFSDTIKVRSFKLCMIITFLRVFIGHSCSVHSSADTLLLKIPFYKCKTKDDRAFTLVHLSWTHYACALEMLQLLTPSSLL